MSQIISEIYEYTVMYTNNITQKLKKWQDGKLKYYKFNNKVQVFAECGIVVTEVFMRNTTCLQQSHWGESFRAGSVLVQIEEMVGESTRDIAPVFQKDHKTRTPSSLKLVTRTPTQTQMPSPTLLRRRIGLSKLDTPSKRRKAPITPLRGSAHHIGGSTREADDALEQQIPVSTSVSIQGDRNSTTPIISKNPKPVMIGKLLATPRATRTRTLTPPPKQYLKREVLEAEEEHDTIYWGTQDDSRELALRIQQSSLATPSTGPRVRVQADTPTTTTTTTTTTSVATTTASTTTTPRARIRPQQREVIRIETPRAALTPLQQNSTCKVVQRSGTRLFQILPVHAPKNKSKVEVYASDSDDQIEDTTQLPCVMVKDQTTETYDYGVGFQVSDIKF